MDSPLHSVLQQLTPTAGPSQPASPDAWFQSPLGLELVPVVVGALLSALGTLIAYLVRERKKKEAEAKQEEERRKHEEIERQNREHQMRLQEAKEAREQARAERLAKLREKQEQDLKDRMLLAVDPVPDTARSLEYFILPERSTKLLDGVTRCIRDQKGTKVFDVTGLTGVGKTTMLAYIYESIKSEDACNAIWLDMGNYNPSVVSGWDVTDPRAITKNLVSYGGFLNDLVRRLLARPIGSSTLNGLEVFTVETERDKIEATNKIVRRLQEHHSDSHGPRIVMFLEDFHKVSSKPIADYILHELIPNLPDTIVVLTRQRATSSVHLDFPPGRLDAHELQFFSKADVAAFTQKRLANLRTGILRLDPDFFEKLTDKVHSFTSGYPQAVGLAGDVIAQYLSKHLSSQDATVTEVYLLRLFDFSSDSDNATKLASLLDVLDEVGLSPEMSRILEVGCIVHRFDAALLCAMLNDPGEEGCSAEQLEDYNHAIEDFKQFSFVSAFGDKYGFHEFVRVAMQRKMLEAGPASIDRYNKLHARAADYYRVQWFDEHSIEKIGYLADTSSTRWKRYELPEWWDLLKEWLYHLKQGENRDTPWVDLLKVYFEGFWYWGSYAPYDLCNILISEWAETQRTTVDQKRLSRLQAFHSAYPVGLEKQGKDDRWRTVHKVLVEIRRDLELEKPLDVLKAHDEDLAAVRALTDIFLAQAYRFGNWPNLDASRRASEHYADAFNIYSTLGEEPDIYSTAYIGQEWAELCIEQGDIPEAIRKSLVSLQLGIDNPKCFEMDHEEIQAVSYMTLGDACSALGAGYAETAFLCYKWGIYHAYKYQHVPHQPDEYTALKYEEFKSRINLWLDTLWSSPGSRVLVQDFISGLVAFWGDAAGLADTIELFAQLSDNPPSSLDSYFLPAGPHDVNDWQSVWLEGSHYDNQVDDVVWHVEDLSREGAEREAIWQALEPLVSQSAA
jgi:hypothetical protein